MIDFIKSLTPRAEFVVVFCVAFGIKVRFIDRDNNLYTTAAFKPCVPKE